MKELREDFRTDCCCGRKVCTKLMAKLQLEKEQALQDSRTCIICDNDEKNCAILPCVHIFCANCCWHLDMYGNKCAVCRTEIFGWMPIHLTD
ncbi:hypothetical protein DPMN_067899 [Dreissena polymorpha]|uniref:RING-type domain-containing protein n=1 Tax=Dreissena polymorpha TaxID=45954 RepID=A0A9D3YWL3_DREPO|nr:hypothetical protein DPMN_067899 [Dreissena polymorpha]